jgi:hypothetical protein
MSMVIRGRYRGHEPMSMVIRGGYRGHVPMSMVIRTHVLFFKTNLLDFKEDPETWFNFSLKY